VRFDGVDDRLSALFTLDHPTTMLAVVDYRSAFAATETAFDGGLVGNSLRLVRTSSTAMDAYAGGAGGLSIATTPEAPHVYEAVFNGASSKFRVDGGAEDTATTGSTNPGGVLLGATTSGPAEFADVDIPELLVYSGELSTIDRASIRAYLGTKYGITVA
jgi:hypothetical protein